MIKENRQEAGKWLALGITPIPLAYGTKRPLVRWTSWIGRTPPIPLVHAWFRFDYRNIGIVLGNGIVALDFDNPGSYWLWRKETGDKFADSKTVRSKRGWHVYVRSGEQFQHIAKMERGGEVRGRGIMVVPPSIHRSGQQYRDLNGWNIVSVDSVNDLGIEFEISHMGYESSGDDSGPYFYGNGIAGHIVREIRIDHYLSRFTNIVHEHGFTSCRCPFHDDHNPSMQINVAEGWAYCHNPNCAAHRKCSVITIVMLIMGFEARDAVRFLASEID